MRKKLYPQNQPKMFQDFIYKIFHLSVILEQHTTFDFTVRSLLCEAQEWEKKNNSVNI